MKRRTMRNRVLAGTAITMICMGLVACGQNGPDPASTVVDMHDNVNEAQDAVDAFKSEGNSIDDAGEDILGDDEGESQQQSGNNGYVFTSDGIAMTPDMEFGSVLDKLGEAKNYYEVKSCAFEGKDKIYSYGSFDVSTYPQGDKDYISYIDFRDDTVTTAEGAYLFMPKADVISMYGDNYTEKLGAFCYEKDGMELRFIFKDDAVASIQYATLVLDGE